MTLSPNGKWLLGASDILLGASYAISTDGEKFVVRPPIKKLGPSAFPFRTQKPIWNQNSTQWVIAHKNATMKNGYAVNPHIGLFVCSIASADVHEYSFPEINDKNIVLLGYINHDVILATEPFSFQQKRQTLYQFRLGNSTQTSIEKYSIPILEEREIDKITLSPDGKLLAWVMTHTPVTPYLNFIKKYFSVTIPPEKTREELWVSNVDGSKMIRLAYVDRSSSDLSGCAISWMPNCRQLYYPTKDGYRITNEFRN